MTPATIASRICVSIARRSLGEFPPAAATAARGAELVEIRLDALSDRSTTMEAVQSLPTAVQAPLLFTNRPQWEGGEAREPEEQRLAPLLAALAADRAWVDIELRTAPDLRRQVIEAARRGSTGGRRLFWTHDPDRADGANKTGKPDKVGQPDKVDRSGNAEKAENLAAQNIFSTSRVIVSWHDFTGTPDAAALRAILREQYESGADMGKMVTMAHSPLDVLRALALLEQAAELNFPLIVFCMGDRGKISRLATCLLGGFMTYAAEDGGSATAPGQLPASKLRQLENLLQ
ncbi:type I 3-dehydroquinate dehydratase [Desulfurivibrio alkaliphilus]|uniref:3-dehydroquinate dehydratase n=1 Tax=Desulfurivibrio alkaliphilus (strain DSM 19089 / UNIQEM U267 / AHT2) TaxID=589865 RepID=D6Z570_DESAT|nr:type I 3-dehydroquinate dehydratase [Desulfurivibrio alkaliphilus]ADH84727.1 3-dehydroquinate dehydratase [Desulfurivibrio alkaliphilus AHT 2]